METLHDAARRLLQELEQRVKRPSGERPERIEPEAKGWEETSQTSGIRERMTERGLETRGQEFDVCNNTAPVEGPVVTTTCPHTKRLVGGAVSGDCCSPALRVDLRAVPRRAWLGGGDPLPRPSSRLHANDNRPVHASTVWSVP
jgi:hypothetical protein